MAVKLSARVKATTSEVVTVALSTKAKAMLLERLTEYAKLSGLVKEYKGTKKKPGRMYRITDEIRELFRREKQGKALVKGCEIDGWKVKLSGGTRKKFDQLGFMKKHGLTQEDFDEFTETVDTEPYIKITAPGAEDDED